MNAIDYATVNTLIRIREKELLGRELFEQLLKAKTFEQAVQILKATPYGGVTEAFESVLQSELAETYRFVEENLPRSSVIPQVFSLLYTYHNLKVLLKTHLAGLNLLELLVPMAAFSEEDLSHLVKTETSETLPEVLVQAVQYTCQEYREFGRIEAIDVLMDRSYFTHLVLVARELDHQAVLSMVQAWADLYNVAVIYRLKDKALSQAFLKSILSEEGQLDSRELIGLAMSGHTDQLLSRLLETDAGAILGGILDMETAPLLSLELASDRISHAYLKEATLEAFGFLPVLAFLYYKEMEVKNLRLLLTGKLNGFDEAILRERMRPIYEL